MDTKDKINETKIKVNVGNNVTSETVQNKLTWLRG